MRAAAWLIFGNKVPQDKALGLQMIFDWQKEIEASNRPYMFGYGFEPIPMLCRLLRCDKVITAKDLGPYRARVLAKVAEMNDPGHSLHNCEEGREMFGYWY